MTAPLLDALHAVLASSPAHDSANARRCVQTFLTARPTADIPPGAWPLLDELWRREGAMLPRTTVDELVAGALPGAPQVRFSLWRGDITRLAAGAIVNAANSGLTGCYQPFHACVDNAIHTAAGPWLRQACEAIMTGRGRPEPTGTATATPGFRLPAEHVIHTVGPIVPDHRPTRAQVDQLADCYRSCLDAAVSVGADSVAFCSISTGVFGYPKQAAAELSLEVLAEASRALAGDAPHLIVVAYTEADLAIYLDALASAGRARS